MISIDDIIETNEMITENKLDVRTITMGISLRDCAHPNMEQFCRNVYDKITKSAEFLVKTGEDIEAEYGIPIIHKRVSVTPIAIAADACKTDTYVPVAEAMDRAAKEIGVNFIGGFSALVEKGFTNGDRILINSIPQALATTDVVCSSVNLGSTKTGIDIMSVNLLLENTTDPVVWRGPVIAGTVKQFWSEVIWKDVDYMFVDMPPGTGDVPLTVFQSIPLDGIIVVASPQELVSMIVSKAVKMAELMNVPILGLVENMSYFQCPDCGKEHKIFGDSHIDKIAEEYGTRVLAKVPIDPDLAKSVDTGTVELFVGDWFENAANTIEDELKV